MHDLWIAIDPGSVVNPAIVKRQVESAAALGLSSTLLEQVVYEGGNVRRAIRRLPNPGPGADAAGARWQSSRVGRRWAASASRVCPGAPGSRQCRCRAHGQRVRSLPLAKARLSGA